MNQLIGLVYKMNENINFEDKSTGKPLILLGGGGHAKVIIDCLRHCNQDIIGITDNESDKHGSLIHGVKVLGADGIIFNYSISDIFLINCLGAVKETNKRKDIFYAFRSKGYIFLKVIHPSVVYASDVILGEGVQLMAGSIIQAGCTVGDNTIVNTKSSIDHDCTIGKNVHIAPGATLSGSVVIADDTFIGAGTTIIQGIVIGKNSYIGAGSLVLNHIPPDTLAYGIPAKVVPN